MSHGIVIFGGICVRYDVLAAYRSFLNERLRPATARIYYERLNTLFDNQSILSTLENLDIDKMIDELQNVKYKNEFSQYKNALLYFLEFQNKSLNKEQNTKIEELENKTKKKYRKLKEIDFQKVDRTIKHLKNKKLRLCYQTLIITGLRVSELAQISKEDCSLSEQELIFSFTGKGGNQEQAILLKEDDKKLFDELAEMIQNTQDTNKVFYSSNYLQQKAKQYNFTCHDLRRAYAKIEYRKTKSKSKVKEKLRHSNEKTTEIYLKSKVKI